MHSIMFLPNSDEVEKLMTHVPAQVVHMTIYNCTECGVPGGASLHITLCGGNGTVLTCMNILAI